MNVSENKQHDKYDEVSKRFYLIVSKIVRDIKRSRWARVRVVRERFLLPSSCLSVHMHTFINSAPNDGSSLNLLQRY